jgi:hypothetical protein
MEIAVLAVLFVISAGLPIWNYVMRRRAMRKLLESLTESQLEVLSNVGSGPARPRNESPS